MFKGEQFKSYVQGFLGALSFALMLALVAGIWAHYWVDQWQSGELYRVKNQLAEEQKVQSEIVKWINGVIQSQQQAQKSGPVPPEK